MENQFGGALLRAKRKSKRPLDFKKSIHFVLRLKERVPSFFNPRDKKLLKFFEGTATKNSIKVYHLIFNHTHCHAVIKIKNRADYVKFVRALTSKLVAYFSWQIKMNLKGLFDSRPWTRIVNWGKDFAKIKNYMKKNEKESGALQPTLFVKKIKLSKLQLRLFIE